ncbi:MAG: thermopsin family protease [Thermoplasmata archaeon]
MGNNIIKKNIFKVLLPIAVVVVLMSSGFLISSLSLASEPGHAQTYQVSNAQGSTMTQKVLSELREKGVPAKYAFLPNFNAKYARIGNTIMPLYSSAPAPMGIGYYGLMNNSGMLTGTVLNTTSFEGSITVNNLNIFYLDADSPYSMSIQLNTVLRNVTLFGNNSFVFWTQNTVSYSTRTHQLSMVDNIWNFSSAQYLFTQNSLYSYDGIPVPPTYYYAVSSNFTNVNFPFTINVYINSTIINNRNAVFFNYTLIQQNQAPVSGSYDEVIFNSTYGMPSDYKTAPAYFQVNGNEPTPTGFLLYDAELMLGGYSGGSTTTVFNINATMQLSYLSDTGYTAVPSAYNFGTDTGETSIGVSSSWNGVNPTAILTTGPSILAPLWGLAPGSGNIKISGSVTPSNAFMFINPGSTFNASIAQWAAIGTSGKFLYELPSGTYSAEILLSNYDPVFLTFRSSTVLNISMVKNMAMGIYTPLYAFDNAQIAALAIKGNGTLNNPYVLENNQYGSLSPLFSQLNDYAFPVFSGLLLVNTNLYVSINSPPTFFINFGSTATQIANSYNLPYYNYLQIQLYNTSHVSIYHANYVTGWFSNEVYGINQDDFPVANIMLWNSTGDLVASNNFYDWGSSLLVYGGSGNVIWGNKFVQYPVPLDSATTNGIGQFGLTIYSSGNTIFNNYFNVTVPAYSPSMNIYNYMPARYVNNWNITPEPASVVSTVNGYQLSGNIMNQPTQSGNFWSGYSSGMPTPYNVSGFIAVGGDYSPIVPVYYNVMITVSGLSNTTMMAFLYSNAQGHAFLYSAYGSGTLSFQVTNGSYDLLIITPTGIYSSVPATITVNGATVTITVTLSGNSVIL